MKSSKVTSGGRVTIPAPLRKKHNLKHGTQLVFVEEKNGIKIISVTAEAIKMFAGFLGTKGKLLKSLMEEKKEEREL